MLTSLFFVSCSSNEEGNNNEELKGAVDKNLIDHLELEEG